MRLTTRGRFAVTAMLDLAIHEKHGPVSLAAISAREGISQSYLEQLFSRIRKHRLVSSVRGPGGGYALRQSASQIFVGDIISAVNDEMDATQCGGLANCMHGMEQCLTHELWTKVNEVLGNYLQSVSLEDLREQYLRNQRGEKVMAKFAVAHSVAPAKPPHQTILQRELASF
jgi:Rrf2 family iron-sulfur cluster assembly transcriptional regulator